MIKILVSNFNLDDSITCGQVFRYEKENDGSYTVILSDRVINVRQESNILFLSSNNEKDFEEVVSNFFDLNINYEVYNKVLLNSDNTLFSIIEKCSGFKIFRLDPFEAIVSYIISANNNVSNIKKSVNLISNKYGKEIIFNNSEYHLFPRPSELKNITIEELNSMKLGFRSKYVYEIINKINSNDLDLNYIDTLSTNEAIEYLLKYKGIGLKVASCILLFGYGRYDVFPIDTWVKKMMKELYDVDDMNSIKRITNEKFGKYSGIAIQYMFHAKRNK